MCSCVRNDRVYPNNFSISASSFSAAVDQVRFRAKRLRSFANSDESSASASLSRAAKSAGLPANRMTLSFSDSDATRFHSGKGTETIGFPLARYSFSFEENMHCVNGIIRWPIINARASRYRNGYAP